MQIHNINCPVGDPIGDEGCTCGATTPPNTNREENCPCGGIRKDGKCTREVVDLEVREDKSWESLKQEFYDFANPTREGYNQSEDIHLFYPKKYNKEIADWWINKIEVALQEQRKEIIKNIYANKYQNEKDYFSVMAEIISLINKE